MLISRLKRETIFDSIYQMALIINVAILGAFLIKAPSWLGVVFATCLCSLVILFFGSYIYLMRNDPDTLRVEKYINAMSEALEREFEYYLENQDSLVGKHNGKVIVIKDSRVIGVFDSELEAIDKTAKRYELGTFLVQRCQPGIESYTQTFHSRVAFEHEKAYPRGTG